MNLIHGGSFAERAMRAAAVGAASVMVVSLLGGSAGAAGSDALSAPPEVAGETVGPGARGEVVIGESEIEAARDDAVADPGDLNAAEQHAEDVLLDASERRGGSLDRESIDVVPLLGGDIVLAVPADIEVEKVAVNIEDGFVDVSASTSESEGPRAEGSGPGMAPYWGNDGDGQYVLTVSGMGDALFTWKREKLMNDGSTDYTWYSYKRKGDAHPFERTGPNARVAKLRVQSYPYDQIEDRLLNWVDWQPASDFHGNEGAPIAVSVGAPVAGAAITFADRDNYKVWRNAKNPGSYWIEMDQGYFIDGGSREAGYALAWKARQGTPGSQHDFQRVVFFYNSGDYTCDEYDRSDTCVANGSDH